MRGYIVKQQKIAMALAFEKANQLTIGLVMEK